MSDEVSKNFQLNLSGRTRFYPGNVYYEVQRVCFEAWMKTGSLVKAKKLVVDSGEKIENFTENTHITTFRVHAINYVVNNPEQARKYLQENNNLFPDTKNGDNEWYLYLITLAAKQFITKNKFIAWAVRHKYYKKAFHIFKTTYHLTDADYNAFDDVLGDD